MINDKIKKTFDSLHADEDLKNKVLALKDAENRPKRKLSRYIPAAAAAAVVGIAAIAAYPMLTRVQNDNGVISENVTVSERSADRRESKAAATAAPETALPQAETAPTAAPAAQPSKPRTASSTDVPYITLPPKKEVPATEYTAPSYGEITPPREPDRSYSLDPPYKSESITESGAQTPHSDEAPLFDETPDAQVYYDSMDMPMAKAVPEISASTVVLAMNTAQEQPLMASLYMAEEPYNGSLTFAEWTDEDYFTYLGRRIEPELADDFSAAESGSFDVSLKSDGSPLFDTRVFAFNGDDGRCVTVQTSKDTSNVLNYLYDSSYIKSDVDGTAAVLIGETEDCTGYMISGSIGYVITAQGLSEDELKALLLSIAK